MVMLSLVVKVGDGFEYPSIVVEKTTIQEFNVHPEGGCRVILRGGYVLHVGESWAEIEAAVSGQSLQEVENDLWGEEEE
jgi:hypothetical protein